MGKIEGLQVRNEMCFVEDYLHQQNRVFANERKQETQLASQRIFDYDTGIANNKQKKNDQRKIKKSKFFQHSLNRYLSSSEFQMNDLN